MNFRTLSLALSTIALATLTACGGGGSDAGTTTSTASGNGGGGNGGGVTTNTDIVSASGTLQTSSSGSSYAASSMGQEAYDALNTARLASGAGALMQSTALDVAATAHASYLTTVKHANLSPAQSAEVTAAGDHTELTDVVSAGDFYAASPMDRAIKAGAIDAQGAASEAIGGGFAVVGNTVVVDGTFAVANLLNSVYHADLLLAPYTHVAIGQYTDALGEFGAVIDLGHVSGYGQVRPAGSVVVNPANGATVSGTFNINYESPRPAASLITGVVAGTPVLASVYNADYINAAGAAAATVTKFEVRNAGGALVDTVILGATGLAGTGVNTDAALMAGTAVAIPKAPLAAGVYSVSFAATIKGVAVLKNWTFTAQ